MSQPNDAEPPLIRVTGDQPTPARINPPMSSSKKFFVVGGAFVAASTLIYIVANSGPSHYADDITEQMTQMSGEVSTTVPMPAPAASAPQTPSTSAAPVSDQTNSQTLTLSGVNVLVQFPSRWRLEKTSTQALLKSQSGSVICQVTVASPFDIADFASNVGNDVATFEEVSTEEIMKEGVAASVPVGMSVDVSADGESLYQEVATDKIRYAVQGVWTIKLVGTTATTTNHFLNAMVAQQNKAIRTQCAGESGVEDAASIAQAVSFSD